MNMIIPAIAVLLLDSSGQGRALKTLPEVTVEKPYRASVKNTSSQVKQKNSTLIGTNALYWVETDALRSQPGYVKSLKKLHIQTMRFPGGEVADNYDWRTNTLNDPNRWPTSKKPSDAKNRMDFDEFMQLQKELGSQPLIVVNLENGFVTGNLEEAANSAAEWVRYANIEKKYGVKYWEIGNESYLMQTRYPLTAEEYAHAFNLFAKKMKAVDPTIKIGANGPFGINAVTLLDKLNAKNQKKVRQIRYGEKRYQVAIELLQNQKKIPPIKWWHKIIGKCKNTIDFIALHYYPHKRIFDKDMMTRLKIREGIKRIQQYTQIRLHKNIPILFTEWNISAKNQLSKPNIIKTIHDIENAFISSGVKAIYFWPLRTRTVNGNRISYEQLKKGK